MNVKSVCVALLALLTFTSVVDALYLHLVSTDFPNAPSTETFMKECAKMENKKCVVFNIRDDGAAFLTFNALTDHTIDASLYVAVHEPMDSQMYLADLSNVNKMSVPLILSTREFASLHRDLGTSGEGKYKLDVGAGRPPGTYAVCFYLYSPVAKRQPESVEIEIMTAFGTAEYAQHKLKKDQQGDFVSLTAVQESVNSLKELWSSMVKIKGEGAYLLMKDRRARRTSESTFSRIWTSTIVVVLVVVGSVYSTFAFTKRTLKKRRLV